MSSYFQILLFLSLVIWSLCLKSFKWQASFPQISPFRNILKMEYICIWSSQQKQNRLFSLTCPIAVLAQTDWIFQVAWMVLNGQSLREKLNILWGIYNKVNPFGAYSIYRNYVLSYFSTCIFLMLRFNESIPHAFRFHLFKI